MSVKTGANLIAISQDSIKDAAFIQPLVQFVLSDLIRWALDQV